ncbi:Alanine racemase, catabolic [Thiorhodovibrio winogradskyi]|uniref:Alanine racemase n=1 Tax=Thiorhodovibrio winogradskyi TaxID=77007 RepID=A0ABZ0SHU5_9GAMM|nr:alanine racemase [Thiorhodovibrio winogradskyi]
MSRPLQARIDLAAIQHNFRLARAYADSARVLAVIKANAYGHGAAPVARALATEANAFGVACAEEALELRDSGIRAPILLLEGPFAAAELDLIDQARLMTVVHDARQLDWVLQARPRHPLCVWLKIDTGMHRLGMTGEEGRAAHARLAACPQVGELVLMTHFARADEADTAPTDHQMADFARLLASIPAGTPPARSLANSAAILTRPDTHADWIRPGIMLYGLDPLEHPHPRAAALRPAMSLTSQLTAVRDLGPGEAIGYGGRFVCQRPTRVGVVAGGYADGYPRHAPDGTPVAVNGQLTCLIGRVSMDMLTVDLSNQPQARPGDPVELWGTQISANAVAAASGTISYELLTGLSRRVPLRYQPSDVANAD